jgi:phosphotransacetylase
MVFYKPDNLYLEEKVFCAYQINAVPFQSFLIMKEFSFEELEHFNSLEIDMPIVVMGQPFVDDKMKKIKSLMVARKAEFLLIGDIFDVESSCRRNRVSLDHLFGAIDPGDNSEFQKMVDHLKIKYPEWTKKEVVASLKKPNIIAEVLFDWQRIDGILY